MIGTEEVVDLISWVHGGTGTTNSNSDILKLENSNVTTVANWPIPTALESRINVLAHGAGTLWVPVRFKAKVNQKE